MPVFQFGSQSIPYQLRRNNRRKTISIAVSHSGVEVVAPIAADQQAIEVILHRKGPWIRTQLLHFEEMNQLSLIRKFVSGEKLPYLGRQYRLKVTKSPNIKSPEIRFFQGQFHAVIPLHVTEDQYREMIMPLYIEWIKQRGLALAKERILRFVLTLQREPNNLIIKDQNQRWGSCTPAGNILLNWRIFLAPASIVDYVLVHELSHLKYMNHSGAYWETVHMLLPDYEQKKEWLRIHGATLFI